MATTLRIGRWTGDTDGDLIEVEWSGMSLRISGAVRGSSADDVAVAREQLRAYDANPDEPVVPIVWSEDSTVDGFYRVLDLSVSGDVGSYLSDTFRFSGSFERVAPPSAWAESTILSAIRSHGTSAAAGDINTNGHKVGIPDPDGTAGMNPLRKAGSAWDDVLTLGHTRTGASGIVRCFKLQNQHSTNKTIDHSVMWSVDADGWYTGTSEVVEIGGTRPHVGRVIQVPPATGVRISNGLVRVDLVGRTLSVQTHNGTAWSSSVDFTWDFQGSQGASGGETVTALPIETILNTPHHCIVRAPAEYRQTNNYPLSGTMDIGIRRGERMVDLAFQSHTFGAGFRLTRTADDGAGGTTTVFTNGVRLTSNDGNGHRWLMIAANMLSIGNSDGAGQKAFVASTDTGGFGHIGVGWENGGTGAGANNTATQLVYEYLATATEHVAVVGQ